MLRVLCVHGVGQPGLSTPWRGQWRTAVRQAVGRLDPDAEFRFEFLAWDDLVEGEAITFADSLRAVARLLGGTADSGWGWFRQQEGLLDGLNSSIRRTAGVVVHWVENESLRQATRRRLLEAVRDFQPDVVLAHSLGSLIGYDALSHPDGRGALKGGTFVSFGSQIGCAFVVGNLLAGRIEPLPDARWYHLYNPHDDVFTAPIRLADVAFTQVATPFDLPGLGDHDAVEYLSHPQTMRRLWSAVAGPLRSARRVDDTVEAVTRMRDEPDQPRRRALLVGIDQYRDPRNRLEGCVNDVFLISSVLQECGFDPSQIRVVFNDRATAEGIRRRLEWLLDGAGKNDQLVFHYSGHGIRLPCYDATHQINRINECLVPYDFDGSLRRAISDEQIYRLYSQLPYDTTFLMVFDCCHAGGLTRSGERRVRGLDPPDDVRHRQLRWDTQRQMWRPREFHPLTPELLADDARQEQFAGPTRATVKLGRALPLRSLREAEYHRICRERGHRGPYMPLILQACRADQLAAEYRCGAVSYGAFSYVLAKKFREFTREQRHVPTFTELVAAVAKDLDDLGYQQEATLVGPTRIKDAEVPWVLGARNP